MDLPWSTWFRDRVGSMLPIWTITPRNSFIQVYPYLRDVTTKYFLKFSRYSQHFFPWLSMKICWRIGWGTPWNLALNPPKKVWKMTSGVHLRCLKSYFVLLNQMISNVYCPWSNCLLLKIPSICCLKSNHVCLVPHFCLRSMSILSPYYYHHIITILSMVISIYLIYGDNLIKTSIY